ncbi:GTP cyclohydrolase II [Nocardiopsis sp. NPDC050513]|uniref:GTP cyclohydrolase II n=1 Tax=Nocardiopsis sp. NPDC050513 TaxID=3364338 RepID=UPI0037BA4FCE
MDEFSSGAFQPPRVQHVATAKLPTEFGEFRMVGYRGSFDANEYVALVHGQVAESDVLVRIHSECLTGDGLGSVRCDCGPQLRAAQQAVVEAGSGIVLYLRGQEGRGIGLLAKIQAYALQDEGADTVDANTRLGLPEDARDYRPAAEILRGLGVSSVRLLTNNPEKRDAMRTHGIEVSEVVPLITPVTAAEGQRYLATKRDRMGHDLPETLGQEVQR